MSSLGSLTATCGACGHRTAIPARALEERLGEAPTVGNVLRLYDRLTCSQCRARKITLHDESGRLLAAWDQLRRCRACGDPIPAPRVAALPGTDVCAACATRARERPADPRWPSPPGELKRCGRCGSRTIVRQNRDDENFFVGCTRYPTCSWTHPLPVR
jgi:RNA polymerase-binding transcription factor DksA